MEIIKVVLGKGKILSGRLLFYNFLDMIFWELKLCFNLIWLIIEELIDYE